MFAGKAELIVHINKVQSVDIFFKFQNLLDYIKVSEMTRRF